MDSERAVTLVSIVVLEPVEVVVSDMVLLEPAVPVVLLVSLLVLLLVLVLVLVLPLLVLLLLVLLASSVSTATLFAKPVQC